MAENVGGIVYTVDMETAGLVSDTRAVNAELDKLESGFKQTDAAAKKASGGVGTFSKATQAARSNAGGFATTLTPLAAAIGGLISIQTLVNMQRMAEQFTVLSSRIARLSTDSDAAAKNYRALIDISSKTGVDIANTVGLWESLTGTLKEMGRTNADVLRLTETLQKIGTIGGSSAEDMSNALRQLGQGLAGGVIRAEEFNSVLEGMPELARQIAQGLGIPFSELRQRMLDGKLTAEDVLGAIDSRTQKVNEEFGKIPRTVSQASNAIVNEMGAAVSALDKAAGASNVLAKALDAIATGIRLTAGNLTDQERLNELFTERQKIVESLAKSEGTWRENMPGAIALREKLKKLDAELLEIQSRRIEEQKKEGAEQAGGAAPTTGAVVVSENGQKGVEALRQQLELSKLQGEARVRLAAIQKLGGEATAAEKQEASDLAAEIYRLDEAQKKAGSSRKGMTEAQKEAKKSAEELAQAHKSDAEAIATMAEAIYQAQLSSTELAKRQAELSLSKYATPEQIESIKMLGAELQRVRDIQQQKQEFGTDVRGKIMGDVDPLSGGAFDDQTARYEAEAEAEKARYAEQLANLQQAKALELEVKGGYQALELEMAQTHANRLAQIDQAKNQVMLQSGQQLFEGLAGATAQFAGEQSGAYRAMFAVSKAFAIAQAGLQLSAAMTQVLGDPTALTPWQKLANVAAVASAGGSLVSAVASATYSGKAQGGPVQSDKMYRINETGAPEIFNAANGRQYMMPNTRGDVVSNKDATSGGNGGVVVNVQNNASNATATATSRTDSDRRQIIDIVVSDIMSGGKIAGATNRVTGTRRAGA